MSGRHRQPATSRAVGRRVVGAGAAGLTAVLALAPLAHADTGDSADSSSSSAPAAPDAGDTPAGASTTDSAPASSSSAASPSDTPVSSSSAADPSASSSASSPDPSSSSASSGTKRTGVTAAPRPAAASTSTQAPAVEGDFGNTKIRPGVQIKSGADVPAGTTTVGSTVSIVEKDPDGNTVNTDSCTTVEPADPTTGATYCPDPPYEAAEGNSVTLSQSPPANAHLAVDPTPQTVPACVPANLEIGCIGSSATITFSDAGLPPTAQDDSASTKEDAAIGIDVLANDTTNAANAPTLNVASGPQHGTATVVSSTQAQAKALQAAGDRSIRYTPKAGFAGTDSFTYTITTANGTSEPATVTVTVLPPPPVARNDSAATTSGKAVTIAVTGNDDGKGGTLSVTKVSDPAHGSAHRNGNAIVYTSAASFVGTDTFTYTISTAGGTDTATVTVKVSAVATESADDNNLADTGTNSLLMIDLAVLLMVGGAATTVAGRRRVARDG